MFDWLFEGRIGVLIVLLAVALLLAVLWWKDRKRWQLLGAGVAVALLLAYLALDWLIETDREADRVQIRSRVEGMAVAAHKNDAEGILKHVSDRFKTRQGTDKAGLGNRLKEYTGFAPEVNLDQFDFGDGPRRADGKATITFRAKTADRGNYRCEATFDYDARLGWRLQNFKLFGPIPKEDELPLPF